MNLSKSTGKVLKAIFDYIAASNGKPFSEDEDKYILYASANSANIKFIAIQLDREEKEIAMRLAMLKGLKNDN